MFFTFNNDQLKDKYKQLQSSKIFAYQIVAIINTTMVALAVVYILVITLNYCYKTK